VLIQGKPSSVASWRAILSLYWGRKWSGVSILDFEGRRGVLSSMGLSPLFDARSRLGQHDGSKWSPDRWLIG